LFRAHVFERLDAGLGQRGTRVDVGHDAADIGHFRHVDFGARVRHAVERQRLGETAEHPAVLGGDVVHVFRRHEAARARHVLRDDGRTAG
jgi:hypothetical protein